MTPTRASILATIPVASLALYFATRAPPPPSTCQDLEIVVQSAESSDAGHFRAQQRQYRYCALSGTPDASAVLDNECNAYALAACGEDEACRASARAQCAAVVPSSGGVVWRSAPFAPPAGAVDGLQRLSMREARESNCACRARSGTNSGCRWKRPLIGGGTETIAAPYGQTIPAGEWVGPCAVTACVESEARESEGGTLLNPECL